MARKINFLDTPSQGTLGEESYVPSKKGLFSVLGDVLVKTSVGLNSASDLAQINQREFEAQQQIDQFISNYRMQNQRRKEEKAQQELDNYIKARQAGLSIPSSGAGLTGRQDMVQIGGQFYQQNNTPDIDTQLKQARLQRLISGNGAEKQPSRFDLEKYSSAEALRRVGGSSFVGLSQEAQKKYLEQKDAIFNQLLKQYDPSKSSIESTNEDNILDTDW